MTVNAELLTGYFALIAYIATLLPSNFVVLFSIWKKTYGRRMLLKNRRILGIICFLFSASHGVLALGARNVDFLNLNTYIDYFTGLGSMLIFTILAVTSNNWSNRKLGKNWKKLHRLTYVALTLLILHLFLAKQGEWDWYTWCAFLALSLMTCLRLLRLLLRYR